jgi:hypothetical protein
LCNAAGCNSTTDNITFFGFDDFIVNESVFVYGNQMSFSGTSVNGDGSTIVINGDLMTSDLNGGASVAVTNIYIDGSVDLDGGGAGLGLESNPGVINISGDLNLWSGSRNVYGDVYVNGSFSLKDARIHGDVYVNGDLTLDWTPWIAEDARIYYTGSISHPSSYNEDILAKCIHQDVVPAPIMPGYEIPSVKSDDWYSSHGYISGNNLYSGIKLFVDSYKRNAKWFDSAENIVIVAKTGDIELNNFWGIPVTGVLFAPNGEVKFSGSSFEGVVIAKEGFFVTSGGTSVTFRNIENYIPNRDDFPWSDSP